LTKKPGLVFRIEKSHIYTWLLPPAIAKRYDEAKLAVTICGIVLLNTSLIMGLATLISPIPPVQSIAKIID